MVYLNHLGNGNVDSDFIHIVSHAMSDFGLSGFKVILNKLDELWFFSQFHSIEDINAHRRCDLEQRDPAIIEVIVMMAKFSVEATYL